MIKQALLNIFNIFKDLLVMLFLVFINARCLYDIYLVARFWGETADYQSSSTSLLLS